MKKKKVIVVTGARPNFMKSAPLMKEFKNNKDIFNVKMLHTGQHYDVQMSEVFFKELRIPKPNIYLGVGSASHAVQTANIMKEAEEIFQKEKPDLVIVLGDVNSTVACSLVASKLGIKVAHVEAGLRSFDRDMPEEINRLVTDTLSDYLFVTEKSGVENLKKEGFSSKKVFFVGNVMIDTLLANLDSIDKSSIMKDLKLEAKSFGVLTLHRPSNVDSKENLNEIFSILQQVTSKIPLVCPLHPRTKKMIEKHGFAKKFDALNNLICIEPQGYLNFIKLVKESCLILTDSGGIQEETTRLKVPCLTMRENTERPSTLTEGSNQLVARNKAKILKAVDCILGGKVSSSKIPKYWDGKAAERIVAILRKKVKQGEL